ncbi:capping protein-inhibiting regulator of actin dynamics isoform X1 [Anolis carolinensis]|uniref:capping protein-inhibiting regulator of actin dynamics isoform X1 n=2 Tax=Anolis carolinensis TaxID=28377 RepID=UPI002F2B8B88
MINLLKKPYKKKSSKFQPFKKLFSRRKKRETTPDREDNKLKPSSSFGNVCNGALSSDDETNNGLRSSSYGMSTRAFSHDSIFIPDGRSESEESIQAMSQDNIVGKVKTLQQQLAKNIKFGQPPQMTVSVKTIGEANASLEADVLLSSPMETEMQQDLDLPESHNKIGNIPDPLIPESLHKTRLGGEEKVPPVKSSSRPKRHHSPSGTIETVNLDAIPLAVTCLDNSAAKHKLSVKPKNQRVSTKHKRLSKELHSVSVIEFEPEILEIIKCEDQVVKQDGHHVEKPIRPRESHEQEAKGKRKQQERLMTEKKIAETEVKSHMENKRVQGFEEDQGRQEGKKQKLQEEEQCLKMEDKEGQQVGKTHKELMAQEHEMQWHQEEERKMEERSQELEEPMHSESEHQELEDQKQSEVETQKRHEEQRKHERKAQKQRKEQKQCEMEAQSQQEEQIKCDLEAQKQWEEQRQNEMEAQRKQEERQRELKAQRKREKERQRELEAQQEEQRRYELEAQRKQEEERRRKMEAQKKWEEQRQHEMEAQRKQEEQRQYKMEAQRKQEEQRQYEMEAQRKQEEQRQYEMESQRKQEEQRQRELEAQMQQEEQRKCELEAQMQQEEQRQRELETQRQHKEQRQCKMEAERQHELEAQKDQEKQYQHQLEAQKQSEEQRRCDMESRQRKQRHGKREEKGQTEFEDKQQKRHQEMKEGKAYDKMLQHGWKDKRQEQEKQKWQEEKTKHRDSEGKRGQELEEKTHEIEMHDELKKQVFQGQKTRQKQKELEQTRNLEGEDGLQKKGRTTKLEKQKRPEQQKENLTAEQMNSDEQKHEPEKHVRSAKHGKCEATESQTALDKKRTQQEDLLQREQGQKPEESKILNVVEGLQALEKPKEQNNLSELQLDKNLNAEEKPLETVKNALPPKEEASQKKSEQKDKGQKKEETLKHSEKRNIETQEQERIHGEELRWQEVDARQTMPRGFTFQVSSGEKQIIFQKVNLSPVSPVKETPAPSTTKESKTPKCIKSSHDLPTSLCVPHTAILVTGAQLCGTAVNLNQIKDTACKSLLGLTEERKMADVAPAESATKPSPDAKPSSSKIKHAQDPQGNQDILAEWASIRSKILKSAENGKCNEKDKGNTSRHSDDWTPKERTASHSNLRKTLSANAKFSITPAWQKFSEVSKTNTGTEGKVGTEAENATTKELVPTTTSAKRETVYTEPLIDVGNVPRLPAGKTEVHHEMVDNTEGCKFAKDLPSFLVPSGPLSKEISQPVPSPNTESHQNVATRKLDRVSPNGEENVSPFGVKLRRTNYSLRFHYDQQGDQKKKKRYSAGDSFDGIPTPLVTPESEQDPSNLFPKASKSPSQEAKDASVSSGKISPSNVNQNYSTATPVSLPTSSHVSTATQEKSVCKSPVPKKPALAPKPTSQTPPPSPLSKIRRPPAVDTLGQKVGKAEPDTAWRKTETKGSALISQAPEGNKSEEEESKEKKSFFPSITMPWREKTEKKSEPLKKERPVLQSRHSIDGSKLMEKVESAQPLWITLALQKQKGFREQQATREERRQAREAKQAEKLAKENASINSQSDNKSTGRTSTLLKPAASEEEKKAETAMSRLERREQLKKSNTLPTSVTVEISNSLPSSPLAKEVTKRFSTPDANPVSTEPAWLALAKRKAKAWSDCPQIIK